MEASLLIIKPEFVDQALEEEIFEIIRSRGLIVIPEKKFKISKELLTTFYAGSIRKHGPQLETKLVEHFSFGPIIPALVVGEDAIARLREYCGAHYDPAKCAQGTFRNLHCKRDAAYANEYDIGVHNGIHSSENKADAQQEIPLIIPAYEARLRDHNIIL